MSAKILLAFVAALLVPADLFACEACVRAMLWAVFPPLLSWVWVGYVAFIILSLLSTFHRQKLPGIPYLHVSLLIIIVLLLLWKVFESSSIAAGGVILGMVVIYSCLRVFLSRRAQYPASFMRQFTGVVAVTAIVLFALSIPEILHPTSRTPRDIVLEWEGTSLDRASMDKLMAKGKGSVEDFRVILKRARSFSAAKAAEGLAEFGDPEVDVPFLIDALGEKQAYWKDLELDPDYDFISLRIEKALRKMTGIALDENTSANTWREMWEKSKQETTSATS